MKLYRVAIYSTLLAIAMAASLYAQTDASDTDRAFVAKVSQGGRYEVDASELALRRAVAQGVKDIATSEVHDHQLVNRALKEVSTSKSVKIAPLLNPEFQQKLDHLKAVASADFDAAYLSEMAAIHDKDEKLFAQEAVDGGASDYRKFAARADVIVKRHIDALQKSGAR